MNKGIVFAICWLLSVGAIWAEGTVHRFALVAGVNYGGEERIPLRYAVSDAENFARVLEEMGGLDPAHCIVLREPSVVDFQRGLEDLRREVAAVPLGGGRTEVVLYYSGHADEKGLLLGEERLAYQSLRQTVESIRADVHITVLDACASGTITRLKGGRRYQPFLVDASSDMKGYAFLTSSSADEAAQESDRINASFFTHYLVSGMRGAADVTGDGKVSLGEAYQFAFNETLDRTTGTQAGAQHPAYDIKLSGTGDVVMTDLRQTSAGLVLAEELDGRFFIRNAERQLVAELYKPAGRSIELGLEPGMYAIRLEIEPKLLISEVVLNEGERLALGRQGFVEEGREITLLRGGGGELPKVGLEFDDVWGRAGSKGHYTISLALLGNHQKQDFNGLQAAWLLTRADARAGSQLAWIGNIGHGDLNGVQVAGVGNYAAGGVDVGQFAGVGNYAAGSMDLGQFAGVGNYAAGSMGLGQFAGVANLSRGVGSELGLGQFAGVVNIAEGRIGLGQFAGAVNIAGGEVGGMQVAGAVNIAGRKVDGMQVAGVVNVAQAVDGAQFAGTVNIAQRVDGLQAGLVNIAENVDGVQLGLVNISREIDGVPIGLFNYSHTGLFNLSSWRDESGFNYLTLTSGSRNFYTSFSAAAKAPAEKSTFAFGMGAGIHIEPQAVYVETDLNFYTVLTEVRSPRRENYLGRMRVLAGRELSPGISAFSGLSFNVVWTDKDELLFSPWGGYGNKVDDKWHLWPGIFAGIRVGR